MQSPPPTSSLSPSGPQGVSNPNQGWMAARLRVNVTISTYYAISLSILIAIFIVGHWTRHLSRSASRSRALYPITAFSRTIRKRCLRTLSGFTSVGHAILVVIFVALNALFSFYQVDYSRISNVAARFGWMATGNLAFVVFLALKNTPLAILTAYSYERLNSLHQIAGYTTLLYTILHAAIYTYYFMSSGRTHILQEDIVTAGIVLGFAMFFTVLAGMTLRRFKYELFYVIHLALFVVIVVTLGLHRPSFEPDKTLIVAVLIASAWFSDRLIRLARLVFNRINNEATVFPLPNGGTRIVLKKPMARARPGKHCYVWLPHIRTFETHPFTIVATEPMELIINTYSGFTSDLHRYASENPGANLAVSVEGPYGTFPDPMKYDKVVLVAGGSGATFTVGLAADMIQRLGTDSSKQIEFIWATRGTDNISWFTQHLNRLISHEHAPRINLRLHLTRAEKMDSPSTHIPSSPSQLSTAVASLSATPLEKSLESPVLSAQTSSVVLRERCLENVDKQEKAECIEKEILLAIDGLNLPIIHGRPDVELAVREAITSASKDERILVAACGPTGLVNIVRNTTASCIRVDGPGVELHCEQFGW
ncbi:putative ferric reductase like transmembrane component protein [Rosellinia necatrix]|uniref:Putative ferric reductase like transmembrane component protein n=1 Tax=Rosellinia necatrix TaxID=77044 RepID=A0A1W2TMF8_ROSNE|nr:putative ferric reductase like transmembrane component protein [Rosellinia necatrix]